MMDFQEKLFLAAFIILAVAIVDRTEADVMVTGTVFCDQCKDGQVSLFDYPVNGEILVLHHFVSVFKSFVSPFCLLKVLYHSTIPCLS